VSREQLLGIGVSRRAIQIRIDAGRLHPLHLGVYAVGHRAVSREGELLAAVLGGGPGAVLSHESAAELWELQLGEGRRIDVTAPMRGDRPGIRFHRGVLEAGEITTRKGIPVTTPERTIVDVASRLDADRLERVIRKAEYEHLTTAASLTSCLSAHEGRRGMKTLRKALADADDAKGITRSTLERRFLLFLRKHRLPMPQLNKSMKLGGQWIEADCLWPEQRVIIELDSRGAHENRYAFESDRARDLKLQAAGWRTARVTWRRLHDHEDALAADVHKLLALD
jgi:very-short-patch-repair endonuclease